MSQAAFCESKRSRRQGVSCRARKARFRYRAVVKADRDHTLCFECFRAERDRWRARLLASGRNLPRSDMRRQIKPDVYDQRDFAEYPRYNPLSSRS